MKSSRIAVASVSLALAAPAQVAAGSAWAGREGFLRVEHCGQSPAVKHTIPAGTELTSGLRLDAVSGVASSSLTFRTEQGSVVTFESHVAGIAPTFGTPGGADLSSEAEYVLRLDAAQQVHGMLWVEVRAGPSGGDPGFGIFAVDVDDDGTIDVVADPVNPQTVVAEFWRTFGPGTLQLRATHWGFAMVAANFIGDYSADMTVRWIAGTAPAIPYGAECGLGISGHRPPDGSLVIFTYPNPTPNTWLLFGRTQTNAPLQLPPHCALLTEVDHVLWIGGAPAVALPYVPLPLGFAMNAQAVDFVSSQSTLLSNGLRMVLAP
jgi:hypothetical protein